MVRVPLFYLYDLLEKIYVIDASTTVWEKYIQFLIYFVRIKMFKFLLKLHTTFFCFVYLKAVNKLCFRTLYFYHITTNKKGNIILIINIMYKNQNETLEYFFQ